MAASGLDLDTTAPSALAGARASVVASPLGEPLLWLFVGGAAAIGGALLAALAFAGTDAREIGVVGLGWAGLAGLGAGALWAALGRQREAGRATLLWQAVGEGLPFPCCVVGRGGRAVFANRSFLDLFPGSLAAPLAHLRRRLGDGPAASERIARFAASAAAGRAFAEEVAVPERGDGVHWLRLAVHPLAADGARGPAYALWTVEDVTARREIEVTIREEQAKLVDFLDNAPVGFYSADRDGRFLLVNRTFAAWLGTTPEELRRGGARLHDFLAEAPPPGTPAYSPVSPDPETGDLPAGGVEVSLRGRGGALIQTAVSQTRVGSPETGDVRTRSVVRDLTPEREWELALRRSEQRFQRFFEDAPVGIVLLDAEGRVTESNRAWRRLVAPADRRLLGRALSDFVAETDAGKVASWIAGVVARPEHATPLDVRLRPTGDGASGRIATLYASRMDDGRGGVFGTIVHFLETTEQRHVEAQMAQGLKMQAVGQLAGGIAHDFNNLLTAMIGFCDLLLLRHSPGDQSFADIMQIKQNASRAARLVRQLLAFSRQQTLQPRVLQLTDVLGDLSALLRRLIGANIRLTMRHGRDLGLVRADQGQIEQVIINLAVNARDAMPDGGELVIATEEVVLATAQRRGPEIVPAGQYVALSVADTGIGIPPENMEHIFEPFFTTKEVGHGTGLGLSTVYGIVKQTGGFVTVASVPGTGTSFEILLPRWQQPAAAEGARAEADAPAAASLTGAGTILLVEDEDAVRLFSARALRAKGYKVLEARTGEAALEMLDVIDDPVDLLITDAVMPEMDGPTLIRHVRERAPAMRVVCISGYAEEAFRNRLGEARDIDFLPKPFSLAQLAGKVKEVLEGAGGR
ncbi:MAG: PAS domain-containing protein [Alphaproteobacteria bacterium]